MWAFEEMILRRMETETGEAPDVAQAIRRGSRAAFWKFVLAMPFLMHRRHTPPGLWHLARLGATRTQGCGACLRIEVRQARQSGVPDLTVHRAASGDLDPLDPLHRAAYRLGCAVAGGALLEAEDRALLQNEIGAVGVTELACSSAMVGFFPSVKRGLGVMEACELPRTGATVA